MVAAAGLFFSVVTLRSAELQAAQQHAAPQQAACGAAAGHGQQATAPSAAAVRRDYPGYGYGQPVAVQPGHGPGLPGGWLSAWHGASGVRTADAGSAGRGSDGAISGRCRAAVRRGGRVPVRAAEPGREPARATFLGRTASRPRISGPGISGRTVPTGSRHIRVATRSRRTGRATTLAMGSSHTARDTDRTASRASRASRVTASRLARARTPTSRQARTPTSRRARTPISRRARTPTSSTTSSRPIRLPSTVRPRPHSRATAWMRAIRATTGDGRDPPRDRWYRVTAAISCPLSASLIVGP